MHGVIRRYRVRLGTVEQAAHYAEKGFLPIVRDIPGFISCHLLDAGNDILTCIVLFETEHSGFSTDVVKACVRYFEAAQLPAIFRVPSKSYDHLARAEVLRQAVQRVGS